MGESHVFIFRGIHILHGIDTCLGSCGWHTVSLTRPVSVLFLTLSFLPAAGSARTQFSRQATSVQETGTRRKNMARG